VFGEFVADLKPGHFGKSDRHADILALLAVVDWNSFGAELPQSHT
jgi:hypothetical protein